jgi:flagellar biosynthesis/type III secretory pathway M-ring protein FliF/YscJ
VSALIWIVMAVGALVLFGMIGYRLPRQVRTRRAERAAAEQAEAEQVETEQAETDVSAAQAQAGQLGAGTTEAPARPSLEPRHP